MTDIITILKNLQSRRDIAWIQDIDDAHIQPFVIQKWLSMSRKTMAYAKWLDRYTFYLQPKQYLLLAWSVLPKVDNPQIRYIKKDATVDELQFIYDKFRKVLAMGDSDFYHSKKYIKTYIYKNKLEVFKMFGIQKRLWKKHGLDFKHITDGDVRKDTRKKGLDKWGM